MPGQPVQLSGPQYKAIGEALEAAFAYDSFERLLHTGLGLRLDLITSKYVGFAKVVWDTLLWAEEQERVAELVAAAKAAVPENNMVQALPTEFATAAQPDPFLAYHKQIVADLSSERYQIDRRFVRLTLLLDQGPDAQGLRFIQDPQHNKYDNLATLLTQVEERALVLLGRPGSGKTTLLRRLQLEQSWEELAAATGKLIFFVSLNGYRAASPDTLPPEPYEWLRQEWRRRWPHLPPLDGYLQQGQLLLLLDGLNEMPHRDKEDYRARIGQWQNFIRQTSHFGSTFLFSCRSLDYSVPLSSEAVTVRQVQVEPLSPAQIEAFLAVHLGEKSAPIWQALQQDSQQLALFASPFFLRLLVEQVGGTGEMPAGRAALLTGFVRRTLRREVVERQHRLFAPDTLLSEDDVQQVIHDQWATPLDLPTEGQLFRKLAALAFAMQTGWGAGEGGQVRVPERKARELLHDEQPQPLIAAGIQLNVLDKELATRELAFYHQLLQEYFAARVLAQQPDPDRLAVAWRSDAVRPSLAELLAKLAVSDPLPALPATGWEETAVLAAAMTADPAGFVTQLLPANLPLAARCAASPEVAVPPELVERLQTALLARIAEPQADLRARIAAAEALGELGDPRFQRRSGLHGDYLRPPVAAIPGGTYTIGDDDSGYARERPAHQVEVAPFAMGVFPVTNAEYAFFMAAGGYEEERWWTTEAARAWRRGEGSDEGPKRAGLDMREYLQGFSEAHIRGQKVSPEQIEFWLWLRNSPVEEVAQQYEAWYPAGKAYRRPEYWDDSRFNHPAQPVVGVSWYEAQAYCAWLAAQTGQAYRLPTEVEWEAAARGREGRAYAYGQAYDAAHGNTFESHIRRTTPVGVYPGGQTPEGIADLSGNVWEWTTTLWGKSIQQPDFPYPYRPGDGRENLEDSRARRVLRGGSWSNTADGARAAYRLNLTPANRSANLGFRLVVVGGGGASSPIS